MFHFVDLTPEEQALVENDELTFEVPVNFVDHPRYRPTDKEKEFLAATPDLIFKIISNILPKNPTLDPLTPFYYLKIGKLPFFVVKWFIDAQKPSKLSNMTLFYRAMHCIEAIRGYNHDVVDEFYLMPAETQAEQGVQEEEQGEQEAEPLPGPSRLKVKLTKGKGLRKKK